MNFYSSVSSIRGSIGLYCNIGPGRTSSKYALHSWVKKMVRVRTPLLFDIITGVSRVASPDRMHLRVSEVLSIS